MNEKKESLFSTFQQQLLLVTVCQLSPVWFFLLLGKKQTFFTVLRTGKCLTLRN